MTTLQQIKEDIEMGHLVSPIIVYERVLETLKNGEGALSEVEYDILKNLFARETKHSMWANEARKASEEAGF